MVVIFSLRDIFNLCNFKNAAMYSHFKWTFSILIVVFDDDMARMRVEKSEKQV